MLLNSLYTIEKAEKIGSNVKATIKIDPNHDVFKGHFPSQSVLPGVCLIEMLKDILHETVGNRFTLSEGNNIKYLKVVDPGKDTMLTFELTLENIDESLKVSAASFLADGSVNFKFKGRFV